MLGINIGIDLGTTSLIACVEGKGVVVSEPSIVAYRKTTGKIMAIGRPALKMLGREPDSVSVVRPMKDGVVSDFTVTEHMLRYYIKQICGNRIFKPNIIISMPGSVTNLEKRTILDVITASGAGRACLMEEPLAAAIGAGIDIDHPSGVMIVDLGGGTTDIAVITMGTMAVASSVKVAGNALNEDIVRYCRRERDIIIGEQTAEEIKKQVGCAFLRREETAAFARGKDYFTGMPLDFEITSNEVYLAMREHIKMILEAVRDVFERTPPELVADIIEEGIILTGGTAQLFGIDQAISKLTKINTRVADDPLNCVIKGIEKVLGDKFFLEENGYLFKSRQDITGGIEEDKEVY
ncbi:MAG: rod shape-determining protein [Clostridia bacterium]|jgi:rod shape-determining protein MreB|nr:rod shape-determining protein [Clostridia bacterium]MBQ3897205.1 rod shape-determining protein [Clostridia bacterium]MBQ6752538.1 rod shape-determining protein [Clostridia bacterium]